MWIIWAMSLLGPLLLAFKKGERAYVAILGFYGLFFWVTFGIVIDDNWPFSSAALFGLIGVYNLYHSLKLRERNRNHVG